MGKPSQQDLLAPSASRQIRSQSAADEDVQTGNMGTMVTRPEIRCSDGTVHVGRNVPPGEISNIDVEDQALTFIRVDHEVRLQFGATEVVIGTAIHLVVGGEEHLLKENADLGPLLALFPDVLTRATAGEDSSLTLVFQSGASLRVPPHPQWEAWEVNGPGTRLIVCPPSGESLAVWD